MVNIWLLLAALVAAGACTLHVYTFEVWIGPKLKPEGFAPFPFGDAKVVMGFYRTVWHFFTVSLVLTILVCTAVAFGSLIPYANLLIQCLMVYWVLIVVEIFVVAALSLKPGQSYIKTMVQAFQWVIIVVMVFCMYMGTRG
jgi:FtsH-binding integral membrane protein